MAEEKLLTEDELLDALNIKVDRTAVWRWRKKGMPHMRVGKAIRYELGAVKTWLEQQPEERAFDVYFTGANVDDVIGEAWEFTMAKKQTPDGVKQQLVIKRKHKGPFEVSAIEYRELLAGWLEQMAATIKGDEDLEVIIQDATGNRERE